MVVVAFAIILMFAGVAAVLLDCAKVGGALVLGALIVVCRFV